MLCQKIPLQRLTEEFSRMSGVLNTSQDKFDEELQSNEDEGREKMRVRKNIKEIAAGSIITISLLGGSLMSSCVPMPIQKESPSVTAPLPTSTIDNKEKISSTETAMYTITPSEQLNPPTLVSTEEIVTEIPINTPTTAVVETEVSEIPYVSTEKNESFDMNTVNILEWEDFNLEKDLILDVSETVVTKGERTDLYLLPTTLETSLEYIDLTKLELPSGYSFAIREKRVISNSAGEKVTLGIVENTFENYYNNSSFALLLDAEDAEGNIQGFVEKQKEKNPSVTYIDSHPSLNINMTKESLLIFLRISESQIASNGFQTNSQISFRDLIEPIDSLKYIYSTLPYGSYYQGTDVLTSLLKLLSQKEPNLLTVDSSMRS
ncbi:MAG TPA: hypothetical protein PLR64_03830, partial [Candidatus Dojkabacteria bacterium]|nr:hypothetical protein [Candidatus Dojkabacteria bacterium]